MLDEKTENKPEGEQYVTNVRIAGLSVTTAADGSYGIGLTWELNGGKFHDRDAKYEVSVFYGEEQKGSYTVDVDKTDDSSGTVSGMKLDVSNKDKSYSISLIYSKDSERKESDKAEIPVYGLSNLSGEYFNGNLNISWDKSFDNYPYIYCDVYRDGGLKQIYEVRRTNTNFQVSIPENECELPLNADIYPTDGDSIYGVVQKLRFFPRGVALTSFDKAGDSLNAEFDFSCSEEESKALTAYFCVVKGNSILKRSDAVALAPAAAGKFKVTIDNFFAKLLPSCTESSCLGVIIEYRNAKTAVFSGAACLPLAAPVFGAAEYVCDGVRLTAEYPLNAPIIGFLGSDNKTYCSEEINIKFSESETFGLRPVFCVNGHECKGVSSDKIPTFCESYSIETDSDKNAVIYYRQNSGSVKEAVCQFSQELFLSHLSSGISSENNVITLEPCAEGGVLYTLKLDNSVLLTADNNNSELNGFFKKLFGIGTGGTANNVTPAGFYMLCGAVSRMCRCKLSDICALSRNFIPESRYCAVLPGDTLKIETSVYTEQTNSNSENITGYTLANVSEYCAVLSGSGNNAAFIFDSFVKGISGGMNFSISAGTDLSRRLSGITDLSVNVDLPYLYLIYPINYYPPDMPTSLYPYDNAFLLGNKNYSTLLDELKDITEYPEHSVELDGVAYFNGRSSVTILIPVYVNGARRLVPAGTSVYGLLMEYGYYDGKFKLYRLNAKQKYCSVFVADGISCSEIILMSGDKIEV